MRAKLGARALVELGQGGCAKGEIRRKGYTRGDGTRVKSACVPDVGAPGKAPPGKRWAEFGPAGKAYLPGWSSRLAPETRHGALRRMTAREGCRTVIRKLVQLANVTRNSAAKAAARADYSWLRGQGFCELKTKK